MSVSRGHKRTTDRPPAFQVCTAPAGSQGFARTVLMMISSPMRIRLSSKFCAVLQVSLQPVRYKRPRLISTYPSLVDSGQFCFEILRVVEPPRKQHILGGHRLCAMAPSAKSECNGVIAASLRCIVHAADAQV